eukprot:scaffold301890_cov33-Tisochrysis_lutea.AAC.1
MSEYSEGVRETLRGEKKRRRTEQRPRASERGGDEQLVTKCDEKKGEKREEREGSSFNKA